MIHEADTQSMMNTEQMYEDPVLELEEIRWRFSGMVTQRKKYNQIRKC